MVVWSKVSLPASVMHMSCSEAVFHPHGCWKNLRINSFNFLISSMKYCLPFAMMPLVLKFRHIRRQEVINAAKHFVELVGINYVGSLTSVTSICVIRHFQGRFSDYTFVFLPTLMGGLTIWLFTPRAQQFLCAGIVQNCVETLLWRRRSAVAARVMSSVPLQTLIFMIASGLILQSKRRQVFKGFWLLTPDQPVQANSDVNEPGPTRQGCAHSSCSLHLWQGVRNYVGIGLTLDVITMLRGSIAPKSRIIDFLLAKMRSFRLRSTVFFGASVAIYRFALCYLNRHKPEWNADYRHMIAACLTGAAFSLTPNLTLLSYALTLSGTVLFKNFEATPLQGKLKVLEFLKIVPYYKIFSPVAVAILTDIYARDRESLPKITIAAINALTCDYPKRVAQLLDFYK